MEIAEINRMNTGFAQTIGMEVTACCEEEIKAHIDVGPEHLQPAGIVNGGVYAAIGETLGSLAAMFTSQKAAVGMNNNTDFLRPVSSGRIEAEAIPVHIGRTTHLWRIEMRNNDKLVAITNLKLMIKG